MPVIPPREDVAHNCVWPERPCQDKGYLSGVSRLCVVPILIEDQGQGIGNDLFIIDDQDQRTSNGFGHLAAPVELEGTQPDPTSVVPFDLMLVPGMSLVPNRCSNPR